MAEGLIIAAVVIVGIVGFIALMIGVAVRLQLAQDPWYQETKQLLKELDRKKI